MPLDALLPTNFYKTQEDIIKWNKLTIKMYEQRRNEKKTPIGNVVQRVR